MPRPQYSAKFKEGVIYLRHKNGIVYPFNKTLENNTDYTRVRFSKDVMIIDKPLDYIPPEPEVAPPEVEKPKEVIVSPGDLAGDMSHRLANPTSDEIASADLPTGEAYKVIAASKPINLG